MSWAAETNIKGPVGPQGLQGPPGPQGPPGTSGTGTGNVIGPAGAVADRIAVYNGTSGTVIKDGGRLIAELALTTALPVPAAALPLVESGAGAVGVAAKYAREDHVHPSGPTVAPATATPLIESGTGVVGTSVKYAREDHVHPATVGGGNVVGPASAVLNRIAIYGDTTGKLIADGGTLISALQPANQAVRYDAAQGLTSAQQTQARQNISAPLRGWVAGLTLSTLGSSPTFSIAAGEAADSTVSNLMQLAASINKTTSAWAVGGSAGALDTGTIAAAGWYHVHLIKRVDTGVVDVLVSLSPTAPTLPANYTLFRRIGSMLTAASQWVKFWQDGDLFMWDTPVGGGPAPNPGIAAVLRTMATPLGLRVRAELSVMISANVLADMPSGVYFSDPQVADVVAGTNAFTNYMYGAAGTQIQNGAPVSVMTNLSSQVRTRFSASSTNTNMWWNTRGWTDRRGRDD